MWYSPTLSCRFLLVLSLLGVASGASAAGTSSSVYESDLRAFMQQIDKKYPFFALKGIRGDWTRAKNGFKQRARDCKSDGEFMQITYDVIGVLRDGHMGVGKSTAQMPPVLPRYYPGISFLPATRSRVVIMHAPKSWADTLKTGTVVTKINGTPARRYLEDRAQAAWNQGGFFSSRQRARLFEYRLALRGDQGQKHTITYQEDGQERHLTLECSTVARGWPHTYNLPDALKRVGRSFYYAKLTNDVGYMYVRRIDTSFPRGVDEALGAHPNLNGWIVDLRGNGGGGYGKNLIEKIKHFPRPVAVVIECLAPPTTAGSPAWPRGLNREPESSRKTHH